ncbi:MAG TPA: hypothetical protein VK563_02850 [Puia sp.]|nr:hypothetical protein [Puia sp.]
MFKTGNIFIDYFLGVDAFLPLLPVILIFIRKTYRKEQLNFLMIVCLLNFILGMIRAIPLLGPEKLPIVNNLFSLLELISLTQLFKPALSGKSKDLFNIFLISFLSVLLTYFSVKGWGIFSIGFDTLQSAIIIGVILLSLPFLVRSTALRIFEAPLFWIAMGTLFYFLIFILIEWVDGDNPEKTVLLGVASFVRYILYTLAILLCHPAPDRDMD